MNKIVVGNRDIVTRDIALASPATGACTRSPIDVILDPGLKDQVILEGESNILSMVEVLQDNQGVLEIGFKRNTSASPTQIVKAYVPMISGGLLEISSTGDIRTKDNAILSGDKLELLISSTGSIQLHASVKELIASISSTGRIELTGSADKARISLSSTGNFEGYDFVIGDATVSLSSVGSAHVKVTGNLVGTISSLGDIIYDGSPASVTSKGGGPGRLRMR